MKEKLIGAVQLVLMLAIALLYLRSCVTSFTDFDESIYSFRAPTNDEVDWVWILPSEELVAYKRSGQSEDAALFSLTGEKLTSLIGPIFNIGSTPLGLRIYSGANEVHKVKLKLVASDFVHCERSSFGDVGDSFDEVFVIYDGSVSVPDDFMRISPNSETRQKLEYWYNRLKSRK